MGLAARVSVGNVIADMLKERDAEAVQQRQFKLREEREAKKKEGATQQSAKHAAKKEPVVAKQKKHEVKKETKREEAARGERCSKSIVAVELSRSQVLARTGFRGPGQNKTFRYGAGKAYATADEAKAAARAWLDSS